MSNSYSADDIQSLGVVGGVRAKPASIGLEGAKHTINEILMNAIDEHREGYGNKIIVTRHSDNSISIRDFGRSIPMGKNSNGEYVYKKIFDEMWGGGKYSNNGKGNYTFSCGTNGCGGFGVSKCSDYFECTAYAPNNVKRYVRYEYGYQVGDYQESTHNEAVGTLIRWIPSAEVFKGDGEISDEYILTTLKQQSIINKGSELVYDNQGEVSTFYYENGIPDYIKEIDLGKSLIENPICISFHQRGKEINNEQSEEYAVKGDIYFTFNNEVNIMEYYHNASYLENKGTPDDFLKNGFVWVIDKWIKEKSMYNKGEKKITFQDIQDSLIVFTDTYSTISIYTDQAKKQIKSKLMNETATETIKEYLYIYFTENAMDADRIANQILINKRSREKANQTRLNIQKKLRESIDIGNRVKKFVDCRTKDISKREIYIVEGDSALGSCKLGRDSDTQGIMPVRGKILNCLKSEYDKIFKSEVIVDLLKVLGCGIEISSKHNKDLHTFDINNLRWDKIIICTDADVDGYQIRTLILTMLYRLTPTLVELGKVYIADTPLYEIQKGDNIRFAYNDKEKDDIVAELGKCHIQRSKGLGENNPDMMWETTMNPKTRKLIQITMDDIKGVQEQFEILLGDNLTGRKQCIAENFDKYWEEV